MPLTFPSRFARRTGVPAGALDPGLARARSLGLVRTHGERIRASATGRRFLNDLVGCFLPAVA